MAKNPKSFDGNSGGSSGGHGMYSGGLFNGGGSTPTSNVTFSDFVKMTETFVQMHEQLTPDTLDSKEGKVLMSGVEAQARQIKYFLSKVPEQEQEKIQNRLAHKFGKGIFNTIDPYTSGSLIETSPLPYSSISNLLKHLSTKATHNWEHASEMGKMARSTGLLIGGWVALGAIIHGVQQVFNGPNTDGMDAENTEKVKSEWRWRNAVAVGTNIAVGTGMIAASLLISGKSGGQAR